MYLLAFCLFAMGTAEFLLAGVLPAVAADLDVTLASAGGLITAFAIGVVIGGPPLAAISLRWPRRTALAASQAAFAASIAVGLLFDTYLALLVTRFIAGLAYAGFFAVAAVTAASLVSFDRAARASGVVVSGLSLAMILGGPAGTLISFLTSWTSGFWMVVALVILGTIATAIQLPRTAVTGLQPSLGRELAVLKQPPLWWVWAACLLSTAAYMITFNYLSALLTEVTDVPVVWVPGVLVLFGVGAFIGLSIGGRISDEHPSRALLIGAIGIAVCSVLIAILASYAVAIVPLAFILGVVGFVLNPAVYGRTFAIAGNALTLAGATTVSMFQLGISLTPALAGLALNSGAPITAVAWIGASLAVLCLIPIFKDRGRLKRHHAELSQ
ncbi:MFS transporter [Aeromicrobium phragmitis]|uniref:MFS transporter n=1 Tax=Aeromicrobium phragmitis TaxID=2478914 RepID=UPI001FB7CACD|nr:MFS transporter [Aeromicrobium phragmitis]